MPSLFEEGLDAIDMDTFDSGDTGYVAINDAPIYNASIMGTIAPGGRVAVSKIAARDLVDSKGRIKDVDALIDAKIALRGGELPTLCVTSDSGALMMWVQDSNATPLYRVNPFGMRLMRKALDGGREDLPNLGKRLSVFNRPFPIQITLDRPVVRVGRVISDAEGNPLRVESVRPFVKLPGQTVIMLVDKDDRMDGCFIIRRGIIKKAVNELHDRMMSAPEMYGYTRDTLSECPAWGRRRSIRRAMDKADKIKARFRDNWNVRAFFPAFLNLGGHLKGDAILSQDGFDMGDVDIISSLDNLKPEMFSTDGKLYIFAEAQHDNRETRWTDRQTMIHHTWILRGRIQGAMERAHRNVIESLRNDQVPEFIQLQKVSVDKEFDDDDINVYARRYALMRAAGVLHLSASGITGICNTRWLRKLRPKFRGMKRNAQGEMVESYWLDTYKFPITASEFRTVKSQALANLAGYAIQLRDGEFQSTPIGVVVSNGTSVPLCRMCGGGDFDDHWCVIHGRAKFACTVRLHGDKTLTFEAGEIFSLFYRLPIGVSSNGVLQDDGTVIGELGTEYMILRPTAVEIERLEKANPLIPTVDLDTRPKSKADLDWSMFPCPATCEDSDKHEFGCPTWVATPVTFAQTEYDFDVFRAQVHNLARQQKMGGVGGIANMDLVLFQHQIAFPFVCHTEDWVDLMTKSIGHQDDMDFWVDVLAKRAELVKAASLSGTVIDDVAFIRIRRAFGRFPGVKTAHGTFHSLRLMHERLRGKKGFEGQRDELLRDVRAEMHTLTKFVAIKTKSRERSGNYSFPPLVEHLEWNRRNLEAMKKDSLAVSIRNGTPVVKGVLNSKGEVKASAADWDIIASWTHETMSRWATRNGLDPQALLEEEMLNALAWSYRPVYKRDKRGDDQMLLNGPLLQVAITVLQKLQYARVIAGLLGR